MNNCLLKELDLMSLFLTGYTSANEDEDLTMANHYIKKFIRKYKNAIDVSNQITELLNLTKID